MVAPQSVLDYGEEEGLTYGAGSRMRMKMLQIAITIAVGWWMIWLGVKNFMIVGVTGGFAAYLVTLLFIRLGWHHPEETEPGDD